MDEFDFNVSQNDGQNPFEGHQDIVLEDNNHKDKPTDDSKNKPEQEKPSSFGVVNVPSTSPDENQNKNIDISNDSTEISKSTLDEPITTTLKRDLINILNKIKYVAVPKMTEKKLEELYNWDLWGPLIFCFLYSIALSTGNTNSETSIFVLIFTIFWVGGFVITFNEKFLGSNIGICQTLSLLGYGMFPIIVAGIIIGFCGINNIYIKLILVIVGLIWSILASHGFFSSLVEPDKKMLAVFPVFIFLFSLSMFALNY